MFTTIFVFQWNNRTPNLNSATKTHSFPLKSLGPKTYLPEAKEAHEAIFLSSKLDAL